MKSRLNLSCSLSGNQMKLVKKELPDFSKYELFSLGLSAAGAALAKDAGSDPILTPRTKKILEIMGTCGEK